MDLTSCPTLLRRLCLGRELIDLVQCARALIRTLYNILSRPVPRQVLFPSVYWELNSSMVQARPTPLNCSSCNSKYQHPKT
jgi:hypothetical protein